MSILKFIKLVTRSYRFLREYNFIISIFGIVTCMICFEKSISLNYKLVIYTISYLLKEVLMLFIPALIMPVIIKSIIEISSKNRNLIVIAGVILFIFSSNFFSIIIAYVAGVNFIPHLGGGIENIKNYDQTEIIYSLVTFQLPSINITNVTLLGLLSGIVLSYKKNSLLLRAVDCWYQFSIYLFNKIFIFLIPIYIIGTILKTINETHFISLIFIFGQIITLVFIIQSTYIGILFFAGSVFSLKKCINNIVNILPALFTGFSTMSSLITLPITMKSIEKNTGGCEVARLSITSTVNCHDIGDCISLPLMAISILYYINGSFPDTEEYLYFAFVASLMQFSTASVPGGSIIILLPVLVKYLNFTQEMEVLILALSICIEPIGTAMNIAGNSAFAIIASKLFKKTSARNTSPPEINSVEVREKI